MERKASVAAMVQGVNSNISCNTFNKVPTQLNLPHAMFGAIPRESGQPH